MTERVLAAIDVGTNSIHMVVVRVRTAIPAFTIIAKEKATVRLGDRDPKSGELTPEAMQRALEALNRCQILARQQRAEAILAVATSAVREAPNGADFLALVKEKLGLEISLISGPEEARRIYLGVLSGIEFNGQEHVVVDIGGGSTELILGAGQDPTTLSSTKIGAVRLTAEFIHTDPISDLDYQTLQGYIRGMLERPTDEIKIQLQTQPSLIGTSGTIEAVATLIAQQKGTIPDPLHGYRISLDEIRDLIDLLRRLPHSQRVTLAGMNERRAEIIIAGAVILQEAMALLGLEQLQVCERALREGLIVNWMLTHGLIEDRLRYQGSVRQRSILQAAQKFHVNLDYSQRVASFALALFDQLQGILHTLPDDARHLLWAAAVLHNCGHHIGHAAHHKHSYYLIRHGELLGYTETEIETIANLARYHRKSGPRKKHDNYRAITSKIHRTMVDLLHPILRLAVALDRRQMGAIAALHCQLDADRRILHLKLQPLDPGDDCALELWSLDQKKAEFEKTFQLKVLPVLEIS